MIGRVVLPTVLAVGVLLQCGCGKSAPILPNQTIPGNVVAELAARDVTREGRALLTTIVLSPTDPATTESIRLQMTLQSPWTSVEDTDIRGYLDGRVKYNFNQGTAYHMRVGRRYNGSSKDEYELKRSLVRWKLEAVPPNARVLSAKARFWLEAPESKSPGPRFLQEPGLHLYGYPVHADWNPGEGGVGRDSFSDAAPGEVSWNEARTGEEAWPAPGGLEAGSRPVASATLTAEEGWIDLKGEDLASFVQRQLNTGRTADLLLKLDAVEEDAWGTEIALLTSDFGDRFDLPSKRPALVLDLEVRGSTRDRLVPFVLESGSVLEDEVQYHPGETVLLLARTDLSQTEDFGPTFWIRGGTGSPVPDAPWEPFGNPVVRRWDWSQFRVGTVERHLAWGEPFRWSILATWVQPGPREAQQPELVLVSPSGETRRVRAVAAPGLRYVVEFHPDEPGLWRYVWSYRPMHVSAPMAHTAQGVFWVDLLRDGAGVPDVEALAEEIAARFQTHDIQASGDVILLNAFIREAARVARSDPDSAEDVSRAIEKIRGLAPEARLEAGIKDRYER